jgi:hypothetical protein
MYHAYVGEETNMSNYRPISPLTTFSKVIENVMYNKSSDYLKANNILVAEWFVSGKECPPKTQLLNRLYSKIT